MSFEILLSGYFSTWSCFIWRHRRCFRHEVISSIFFSSDNRWWVVFRLIVFSHQFHFSALRLKYNRLMLEIQIDSDSDARAEDLISNNLSSSMPPQTWSSPCASHLIKMHSSLSSSQALLMWNLWAKLSISLHSKAFSIELTWLS